MKKISIFHTPIWTQKVNNISCNHIKNIFNYILTQKETNKGRTISNVNGWQSNPFIYSEIVNDSLKHLFNIIMLEIDDLFKKTEIKLYFLDDIWFNVNGQKCYNKKHIHDGLLSGVFYLTKNNSDIIFYDDSILQKNTFEYKPKFKELILFPAWLPHSVKVNEQTHHRVSIAFNIGIDKNLSRSNLITKYY